MRANHRVSAVFGAIASLLLLGSLFTVAPAANAATGTLSYVSAARTAGARTSHTVRIPTTVQPGDTLVMFLTINSSTGTISDTLTGWTRIQSRDGTGIRGRAWTRTATATDAGRSVTVRTSASVKSVITVAAYRSTIGSASVSASAAGGVNTTATSHTTPSVAVGGENAWLLSYWSEKSSTATTWTLPAGTTSRSTGAATGTGKVSAILGDSNDTVAVGTAAGRTARTSTSVARSIMFSLVVQPGTDEETPGNSAPAATFTSSCIELTCDFDASGTTDADGDTLTYAWAFGDGATGSGITASHSYATAGTRTVTLTVDDGTATESFSRSVTASAPAGSTAQPRPGHTRLAPALPRTNIPRITGGEIWDLEVVGTKVYVAGGFTSARNATSTNTTTVNQANLLKFDLGTGLIDTTFRPVFEGGGVTDVEASPDGTKLFVAGRFNTINGVTKRKFASISPSTGAAIAGFTANANGAGTELEATDTTVYVGGQFTTINGTPKNALAAVNAGTGALVGRTSSLPGGTFNNDLTGGIGPNGLLTVQELKLTHDNSTLLVVHTGRQIAGQNRYGVGLINTGTQRLLPWRTRLWEDNLGSVGGIQRIYAGDISPDDSYFVVGSGSGGDRPPINDTIIRFNLNDLGDGDAQPVWVSRAFDSVYSIAATEEAIYFGGHFSWNESPTAKDPWPGLDNVGYGTGQGLSGYGLGDDVVRRDHVGALDPALGKAVEWNPGSNSFEGNKAMIAVPRGVITGGDATTQGGSNIGRVAFYDLNTQQLNAANDTAILTPIEGRVEEAGVPFTIEGTARATSGVRRVQLEVMEGSRYLQDDLVTWGGANTIPVSLANPNATSTTWSLGLTIGGNRALRLLAKTFAVNGSSDATKATKKIETFSTADKTPTASITSHGWGAIVTSTTFTIGGSATDDFGVSSLNWTLRDESNRYLQDDGSAAAGYNAFGLEPDVPGALSTTWSVEVTVPTEGEWKFQVTPVDTAGQSSLDTFDRRLLVNASGVAPSVTISEPTEMIPPTVANPLTVAPGDPITFAGTASDEAGLRSVEIRLSNTTTRENLASDGTWSTDVNAGWYRVGAVDLTGTSYDWSYTTPFNLKAGTYSFIVRAHDDDGLTTASTNFGRLTVNAQVEGDAPPNALLTAAATPPATLQFDLNGTATDDLGVTEVRLALREADSNRYLRADGSVAAGFATVPAVLSAPGAVSTDWTLSVDLPVQGDWNITAYAFDTAGQQDTSTTGATARYLIYPGDEAPVVVADLLQPNNGMVFTEGRIFVSGRVEDDQQIAQAQVAVVNSAGQYLDTRTGVFGPERWNLAFLNSPGSPGSNYSLTTPVVPAGDYTVRVRGMDQHELLTNPSVDVTVTVQVPATDPPVAGITYTCDTANGKPNVCTFDARSSTDENPAALTYAWSFGTTPATTGAGALVTKTYQSAGDFTVTLTAKDEWGVTGTATQTVTITEPPANTAPTNLVINTPSCTGLTCNFSGSYGENLGDSVTRVWSWSDVATTNSSTANVTTATSTTNQGHAFPAAGTYTVTLTATDGWGKASTVTREVTLTGP